ncbi:MAG: acyltransferase [Bacteroidales bacterium]|nr:acyltransferase [Bacteroidales bacterium]
MKAWLMMSGIPYGKSIHFFGLAKFKRANLGKIRIGDSCVFRSMSTSNLIGINRPCIISALEPGSELIIGNNCGFSGTVIGCFKRIEIGPDVMCGANTLITDSDWHPGDPRCGSSKPIILERNVWLGVNVTVLKGVTIGENSIIGAGSIVTADIPKDTIAAGNPCKVIKKIK